MLDKVEPPSIPEGYSLSVAFSALLDLVRGITSMIERELAQEEKEVEDEEEYEEASQTCSEAPLSQEMVNQTQDLTDEREPSGWSFLDQIQP